MCSFDDKKKIRHKGMGIQKNHFEYGFCFIHLTQPFRSRREQRKAEKIAALVLKQRPNARSPTW